MTPSAQLTLLRQRTIWQTVCAAAAQHPDRDALVATDDAGQVQRIRYKALQDRIRALSAALVHIGVARGDRVVLWMTNTIEWVVCSFAAQRIGAVVVPVNTFLKPPEVAYILEQSGAQHLILLDRFRKLDLPAMLAEICPEFAAQRAPGGLRSVRLPALRNVVLYGRSGLRHAGAYGLSELEALGRGPAGSSALELADRAADGTRGSELGMIKYTSGSTGFPKGAMLEQGGIVANGVLHSRRIGIRDGDVFFSMMPFFHGGGSIWGMMTMLASAGTLVFTEAFNATLAVELIEREGATILFGVLGKEVAESAVQQGRTLSRVRIADNSTAAARRALPNASFCFRPFGLTETYGPAAVTAPDDPAEQQDSCGRLLEGNELRVVDPVTGRDVQAGEAGEAWVRGNVFRGYWNNDEQTRRALDADGWLHTEDLVRVDAAGYIRYAGRIKLMLKVGGENVSVEEVESVVGSHAAVSACAVVGVQDARKGEAVRAYVALRPAQTLAAGELRRWLEPRLARFKQPRDIVLVETLPRLANGKLDRLRLAEWGRQEVNP